MAYTKGASDKVVKAAEKHGLGSHEHMLARAKYEKQTYGTTVTEGAAQALHNQKHDKPKRKASAGFKMPM